ncbi:hypothetical protein J2W35_006929 [Variovorax boronicumulans]|uniref:hypothetical protein n=1 Tax=Variovorax boronicumulans TaxID=436515 RepID=UPI00277F272F|nr:hypothetical protein [Variovorax boronicumulans]MDQ0086546.1 hypothetical protein [Variovorax boronicumulans]
MFWKNFSQSQCCLCGAATANLTGEHKIKASALKAQFGRRDRLLVGVSGGSAKMKSAQSTNSKHLKFKASLCEDCNSSRTQEPDREFDRFNELAHAALARDEDPANVFLLLRYAQDSEPYLNVFRYFAKVLCCQIAAVEGPSLISLAKFAINLSSSNRIWLEVKRDPVYSEFAAQIGEHGYAAHGGLVAYFDKISHAPNAFHSTQTNGPLQYVFHTRLNDAERSELLATQTHFSEWCRARAKENLADPVSEKVWERLGLAGASAAIADLQNNHPSHAPPKPAGKVSE